MSISPRRVWRRNQRAALLALSIGVILSGSCQAADQPGHDDTSLVWNGAALQAIRDVHPGPTIAARSLAIVHTCIFDAWSAFDQHAIATRPANNVKQPIAERTLGNKSKAISFAAYLCLLDQFPSQKSYFASVMNRLGHSPAQISEYVSLPSGVGTRAAREVLKFRHRDGSNQMGDLRDGRYSDYTGYRSVNEPDRITNADRWQPLAVPNGRGGFSSQGFLTPHWGKVVPFALKSGDQFRPAPPASLPSSLLLGNRDYHEQALEVLQYSANLTDEQKVIAEYWVDGRSSATPPGHWLLFAEFVSRRDRQNLDGHVKMFFALANAMLDASIACWDTKRAYDSVRPISAIRHLYATDKIMTWGGPGIGRAELAGADWIPYQTLSERTPPFPEFTSGHSTFSAAAAEILRRFTGSDIFGFKTVFAAGSSRIDPGVPKHDTVLTWATFSEAADQAGLSRRIGGIHFKQGDLAGREMGRKVAEEVWKKAVHHFGAGDDQSLKQRPTASLQ